MRYGKPVVFFRKRGASEVQTGSVLTLAIPHAMCATPVVSPWEWLPWLATRLPGSKREAGQGQTDEELVAEAARGERWAFDALYQRHVDAVWRRLTRLLGPDPEREDLTQQIFLEVFRGLARFRGDASFATYLYRVATNAAYDQLKRRGRRPVELAPDAMDVAPSVGETPEELAERKQTLAVTWSLLERIKPKKRVAFVLRVVEELSLEEVALQVDSNVPTVAQRVRHAHKELMAMLARRGLADEGDES